MESLRGTRRPCALGREWTTIFCAILLSAAGYLDSLSSAQSVCGVAQTTPIRVGTSAELGTLRAAVNCTGGGTVEVDLAGVVVLDSPISIADGTSLSMTGEDDLAEVRGGDSQVNGTRLFEVSPGGGLNLTKIKVSGGSAGEGGAIHSSSGTLTFCDCVFEANAATDGNGGAVWASGGDVTIVGGVFLANTAFRYGGAVHATDGVLEVQGGARFEDNEASVAGALFCGSTAEESVRSVVLCSLTEAEFSSNRATSEHQDEDETASLDGGGAAAFHLADATVTKCVFNGNYAATSGGALFGGPSTNVMVDGCTFGTNTAEENGGALSASFMTLGGGTRLANNSASNDGGAVYGWDPDGTIVFDDVFCTNNSAIQHEKHGGCLHSSGKVIINDGTVMLNNHADRGGGLSAGEGGDILVNGGEFTGGTCSRGGFLFAGDNTTVKITGGLFADNTVTRRGGALYVGEDGVSDISIEGGTFRDNTALEAGGAISVWGTAVLVTVTGGTFANNTASFFGGFVSLELGASIHCAGATISSNFADEQGGGFYARDTMFVNSSCDLIANESPQGAAIYLADVTNASFENHNVTGNLSSSGDVVDLASTAVVAKRVTFKSVADLQEYTSNGAIRVDDTATLHAERCVFDGWRGETVIFNFNSAPGSLVLDNCDFSRSSPVRVVVSPFSDAEIRNAIVSSVTFENVFRGTLDNSLTLVDRALDCRDPNACGPGECVNSPLGVLCECLEGGECLDGGGELSLRLKTSAKNETFRPEPVSFELLVSSAISGTTSAIWALDFEGGDLDLTLELSSGVLHPGGTATVTVTGTPSNQNVGGDLASNFSLKSVGNTSTDSTAAAAGVKLEVVSTYYLCQAYEYAMPLHDNGDNATDVSCEQCASIEEEDGVDCESPGATLASLPISPGYWRSNNESRVVLECFHVKACKGATTMSSSEDYCAKGYSGPYCAVCGDDYGSGVGHSCHPCDDTQAHFLIAMGVFFFLVLLLFLYLAVVFLIGGLDAIDIVRQSVGRKFSVGSKASSTGPPVSEARSHELGKSLDVTIAPAYCFAAEAKRGDGAGGGQASLGRRVVPTAYSDSYDAERAFTRALGPDVGGGARVKSSDGMGRYLSRNSGMSSGGQLRLPNVSDSGVSGSVNANVDGGGKAKGCSAIGDKFKRFMSRLPLDKLKILVVVWQILAAVSRITAVEFPASYARFLSWISVVNLDIGSIFSASCVLPSVNFYASLLVTTLAPLVLAAGLVLTYQTAKLRAGIGSAGVTARRAAWSRHVQAGLLLTFFVFTSASTAAFKTFTCDKDGVEGESYLRADYSISCETSAHVFFQVYAGLMILVYPAGIPVLYAVILWINRELLNPRLHTEPDGHEADEGATKADPVEGDENITAVLSTTLKGQGQTKNAYSFEELQELDEKVKARRVNPELVPSMILWKDFGPDLYYYEVVECGRRILLTGLLIFISPHTSTQAAMACLFAFASLLGFELMRPHIDPADSWLYRLGCVIIFLSNFLGLLIKVDAGEEDNRAAFGVLMVFVNVLLVVAVIVTSWFAVQQSVDDSREDEN